MDLTAQPLWNYSMRHVLVLMELRSRRVVHVGCDGVAHPGLGETADKGGHPVRFGAPFLVHDNDGVFGQFARGRSGRSGRSYRSALDLWFGEVLCIEGIPIPYGAANAAAHIECTVTTHRL